MKCRNKLCFHNVAEVHIYGDLNKGNCSLYPRATRDFVKDCKIRKAFNRIDFELKKDNFMQDYWRAQLAKLKGE